MSGKIYTRVKERQAEARYYAMLIRARSELFAPEPPKDGYLQRIRAAVWSWFPSSKGRT
jgi:hypothetical protein